MGRDTRTGDVLERTIVPALEKAGYSYERHRNIGRRLGGRRHLVDYVVTTPKGESLLISTKWQQSSGTAEQKVPFEIMCLADAVRRSDGKFPRAYVVLGGDGWTLRDYYTSGKYKEYLINCDPVSTLSLESFISRVNRKEI